MRKTPLDFPHNHTLRDGCVKSYHSRTIVHAKLEMTEPGDHDEQEADAVANTIVSGGKIARKISGGGGSSGIAVSQQMESQLSQLQGGGRQMPDGLRNMMESGFGHDFSQVRLHTDSEATSMSSSIHAKAFTLGNDIYFNRGQFAPETSEGQRLVAHELTHVVQGTGKVGREDSIIREETGEDVGNNVRVEMDTEIDKQEEYSEMIVNDYREAYEIIKKCDVYVEKLQNQWNNGHTLLLEDRKLIKRWFDMDVDNKLSNRLSTIRNIYQTLLQGMKNSYVYKISTENICGVPDALSCVKSLLTKEKFEKEKNIIHIPYRNGDKYEKITTPYFDEKKPIQNYFDYENKDNRIHIIIHELTHRILNANHANDIYEGPDDIVKKEEFKKKFHGFDDEIYGKEARTDDDKTVARKNKVQRWKRDIGEKYGVEYFDYAIQNADSITLFAIESSKK